MIDAEVIRLRRLRRTALLTRALARSLAARQPEHEAFARSAVTAWSIARLMTGRLLSHPNLSYQHGPGALQSSTDGALAAVTALVAVKQGRPYGVCAQQLQILTRELDDVRALTWSADLSDALGRAQWQLLKSLQDLNAGIRREGGAPVEVRAELQAQVAASPSDWPYLAI
jgi:hypothetical protein